MKPNITAFTSAADLPAFLSVAEVGRFLRRSPNVIYAAVRTGQLASVRIAGKKIAIPRSALVAATEATSVVEQEAV